MGILGFNLLIPAWRVEIKWMQLLTNHAFPMVVFHARRPIPANPVRFKPLCQAGRLPVATKVRKATQIK
jgi:uncharacterized membrane protein